MEEYNPYYLEPITAETLRYFVNRERELEKALYPLRHGGYRSVPVIGSTGTGKTSFLNVLKYHLEKDGRGNVLIISALDIIEGVEPKWENGMITTYTRGGGFREMQKARYLFIDDIDKLDDDKALEVYEKLIKIAGKNFGMAYVDRKNRDEKVKKVRGLIPTERPIYMDLKPEEMVSYLNERFRRGAVENRFEDRALYLAAEKANRNLRSFFKYSYHASQLVREGEITEEMMKDSILLDDLSIVADMDEFQVELLHIVVEEGSITNGELIDRLKERMGEFRLKKYYDARRYLEENGFLRVEWRGKNVVIRSFHRELGIELTPEMVEDPLTYISRIERKYAYMMEREEEKESELMFSSGGQVE